MKKVLVVLSSVALLGLLAVPGFTQGHRHWGGGPGGMGGPGMMLPFMLKKLDLTSDQQTQVDTILANHRAKFQSLFSQMETAHDGLAEKLFTSTPKPLTTSDLDTTEISKLRGQLMDEGLQVAVEIHNVLTPEQLAKASELHAKMKALHDQMRGMMEDK